MYDKFSYDNSAVICNFDLEKKKKSCYQVILVLFYMYLVHVSLCLCMSAETFNLVWVSQI